MLKRTGTFSELDQFARSTPLATTTPASASMATADETTRVETFLEIVCTNAELLAEEFDEIIATNYGNAHVGKTPSGVGGAQDHWRSRPRHWAPRARPASNRAHLKFSTWARGRGPPTIGWPPMPLTERQVMARTDNIGKRVS